MTFGVEILSIAGAIVPNPFIIQQLPVRFALVFAPIIYIILALAWMIMGEKLKYKYPLLAWIPFANISMILQMGGFNWAWVFLALIPILGWIALGAIIIVSTWRIFGKRNYPGWLALAPLIGFIPTIWGMGLVAYVIILSIVAWRDRS